MPTKKHSLANFRPQQKNANGHTPRGMGALSESMSSVGWFGAITTALNGETVDGSARLETAFVQFGEVEPIVMDYDGTRPVVLRRIDIPDADHPRAKELSIAANRVPELNINWQPEVLLEAGEDVDLSKYFYDGELELLAEEEKKAIDLEDDDTPLSFGGGDFGDKHALAIVLEDDEFEQWERAKEIIGLRKDTKAFLAMLKDFLEKEL